MNSQTNLEPGHLLCLWFFVDISLLIGLTCDMCAHVCVCYSSSESTVHQWWHLMMHWETSNKKCVLF